MDLGFHQAVANAIGIHLAAEECIKQSKQLSIDGMSACIGGFDSRLDKQKFLEANNQAFMIPKKFEFLGPKGDDVGCLLASLLCLFIFIRSLMMLDFCSSQCRLV